MAGSEPAGLNKISWAVNHRGGRREVQVWQAIVLYKPHLKTAAVSLQFIYSASCSLSLS